MHCIKLNDLSQQRTFPINDTKYKCESVFFADIKFADKSSKMKVNVLWIWKVYERKWKWRKMNFDAESALKNVIIT